MPYASENIVSTDPIEGGIEITEEQYSQALEAMCSGMVVTIVEGFAIIDPPIQQEELDE